MVLKTGATAVCGFSWFIKIKKVNGKVCSDLICQIIKKINWKFHRRTSTWTWGDLQDSISSLLFKQPWIFKTQFEKLEPLILTSLWFDQLNLILSQTILPCCTWRKYFIKWGWNWYPEMSFWRISSADYFLGTVKWKENQSKNGGNRRWYTTNT